jgi:two-component system, NtrC family, sensor kinase
MRGFRTKIALHVVLLLLFSAIITNALAVLFAQGVLVRDHIDQQVRQLDIMGRLIVAPPFVSGDQPAAERAFAASSIMGEAGWSAVLLVDAAGGTLYERIGSTGSDAFLQDATATVLRSGRPHKANMGVVWAAFWWQPHAMLVSVPIAAEGRLQGAVAAMVPLEPVYHKLRQYNKPVWILILLNTAILSLVGLYRIFRIYLRPIDRIVRQADGFSADEDLFFTFRREDDELNRLSSSLNRMLKKISTDQEKLRQTVVSLEAANAELQRAQHEIIRSEKMAAVGRLAAGIAHEIGNPIGIVLGYLDLLKRSDLAPEEYDDFARRAEAEIQRISTIISQLLDLARPKENISAGAISVHAVLEDIVEVMAHQPIMSKIEIRTRLKAADDAVWGNADQLRQVFLNLLLNASDAIENMPGKAQGRIAIVTSSSSSSRGVPGGAQWIAIEVGDNGEGIAADRLANIFDPFYTTKEPGKGTGLGLAVSFMIVEQMGGTIEARSVVGQGTTLVIHLPMYGEPANVEAAGQSASRGEVARP